MSFSYLNDRDFVDFVLEKGSIPFLVRGSVLCRKEFNFAPNLGVKIAGPNYDIGVKGTNEENPDNVLDVHIQELNSETMFRGEIELFERTIEGISKALNDLELWADFLCLAAGNPKVIVEAQKSMNVYTGEKGLFDSPSFSRWEKLISRYFQLESVKQNKISGALWWYRKASSAKYYSLFDGYTAYWNCLEILCDVSGSKQNHGEATDQQIDSYLKGKKKISAGHILHCYNNFVNYSIKEQMKDSLKTMVGNEQASQVIYQCFEIKPEKERLYQIRNDINHGNNRENSDHEYIRVRYRGWLLSIIVSDLIHQKLGFSTSSGFNVNKLAEDLQSFRSDPGKEPPISN